MKKIALLVGVMVAGLISYAGYYVYQAMPIGTGYSAKYICSQVFIAHRDPEFVFQNEVKPINPLFLMVRNQVDETDQTVTATGLGFIKPFTAVYRKECGCTLLIGTRKAELNKQADGIPLRSVEPNADLIWPAGESVDWKTIPPEVDQKILANALDAAFKEPGPDTKRNTQAIVVAYKDRIVAEKYADHFSQHTPMLGWSMSKSVTNALVGILVKDGRLDIMAPAPVDTWKEKSDPRHNITVDQLLRMSSGLDFEEKTTALSDLTLMLYDSKSAGQYASAKPLRTHPDGAWQYSSGTANIISKIVWQLTGGTLADFTQFSRSRLFEPIGMHTAIFEPDASGCFVGSSYMFASARDWARFGVLIKNDGVWGNERILPQAWVKYSTTPTPFAPQGKYGAQFWLNAGSKADPTDRMFPTLPADMICMMGFNGQITAVIPSRNVVIVRLGVTLDRSWDHEVFIRNVIDSVRE